MTNTTSTNAQQPASLSVPLRRDWTTPVLDILALEDAEITGKTGTVVFDGQGYAKSHL